MLAKHSIMFFTIRFVIILPSDTYVCISYQAFNIYINVFTCLHIFSRIYPAGILEMYFQ